MVTTEIIRDGIGNVVYRVARIFPNAASASRAAELLGEVSPEAFAPIPEAENITSIVGVEFIPGTAPEPADIIDALQSTDDDFGAPGEPPRCKSGACDL